MNANRRLQERKQPERIVFCKLGGEQSSSVMNLSEDGLCFESLTPIEEKGLLQLRLSVDPNSAIEASAQLAWIDSAKRTGGLRFLELSAPAREQIRAWLSETSTASSGRDWGAFLEKRNGLAIAKPVIWREMRIPSLQLIPIGRYRAKMRWQFLYGALMGFGVGTAVIFLIFRYAGGTKPGSPAWTAASANRAGHPSAEQTQASVVQPVSPSASVSEPIARKPLAPEPTASPQRRSPQTAGASSTAQMTHTSSPSAPPQSAKAEQPLGESQAAGVPASAASKTHSSSGPVEHAKKVSATPQQLWSLLQAGNTKAAVALADLYTRGDGVPASCEQARILLRVASEKNNREASRKLQELDQGGCPTKSE